MIPTPDTDQPDLGLALHEQIGRTRAMIEVARGASNHTARQIVYALGHGGAQHPDLGLSRLCALALLSEDLSGATTAIGQRFRQAESPGLDALDEGDQQGAHEAIGVLVDVCQEARRLADDARALRRQLPRSFGDPLGMELDWPTSS